MLASQYRPAGRKGSDSDCHVRCLTQSNDETSIPDVSHKKKVPDILPWSFSKQSTGPRVLSIIHGKGEVADVFRINLATLPILCMHIPIKHVQRYHVYCRFDWSAFKHLANHLICNAFSDSIIVVVIII